MEAAPCLDSVSSNCIEWDSVLGIIEWSKALHREANWKNV